MKMKCPYPEPRIVGLIDRYVEPGEIVEVPEQYTENFSEAGWLPAAEDNQEEE